MDFPKRLKILRNSAHYTQSQFAEILNVSQRTIANWEGGERQPDLDVICRLSQMFNVSTDWILGVVDKPYQVCSLADGSLVFETDIELANTEDPKQFINELASNKTITITPEAMDMIVESLKERYPGVFSADPES